MTSLFLLPVVQPAGTLASALAANPNRALARHVLADRLHLILSGIKHAARDYQLHALCALRDALDQSFNPDRRQDQMGVYPKSYTGQHFLFHMATGSGKTWVMAGAVLELYRRGYRRFLVVYPQNQIGEKTRLNLLPALGSAKLEFGDLPPINGVLPRILESTPDFALLPGDDIEVRTCSIQDLHNRMEAPRENQLGLSALSQHPLVVLADEAHHYNSQTKGKKGDGLADEGTWESTIRALIGAHPENLLLEFSATVDMNDKAMLDKYAGRLVFDYPLARMREQGYSKNVTMLASPAPKLDQLLVALLVNQYRYAISAHHRLGIVPRVLVKQVGTIEDMNAFAKQAESAIASLDPDLARRQVQVAATHARLAAQAGNRAALPMADLLDELVALSGGNDWPAFVAQTRDAFSPETTLFYHSALPEKERQRNALLLTNLDQDPDRRLVFAVDAANEGLDILSLYDIVKLDDQSQVTDKTTTSEVQLIGRAARPCPFQKPGEGASAFVRAFDDSADSRRWLESMGYHSTNDSAFIKGLTAELVKSGLVDSSPGARISPVPVHQRPAWTRGLAIHGNTKQETSTWRTPSSLEGLSIFLPGAGEQVEILVDAAFLNDWGHLVARALRTEPSLSDRSLSLRFGAQAFTAAGDWALEWLKSLKVPFRLQVPAALLDSSGAISSEGAGLAAVTIAAELARASSPNGAMRTFRGADTLNNPTSLEAPTDKSVQGTYFDEYTTHQSGAGVPLDSPICHYPCHDNDNSLELALIRQVTATTNIHGGADRFWMVRNPHILRFHDQVGQEFRPDFFLLRNVTGLASGTPVDANGRDAEGWLDVGVYSMEPKGDNLIANDAWKERLLTQWLNDPSRSCVVDEVNKVRYCYRGLPFFTSDHVKDGNKKNAAWDAWIKEVLA